MFQGLNVKKQLTHRSKVKKDEDEHTIPSNGPQPNQEKETYVEPESIPSNLLKMKKEP